MALPCRYPSCQHRCLSFRQKKGCFTLIELFVVIGIIAVLAGLLLPVLGSSRERAKLANCLSNVKQITMANLMYADDSGGYLVPYAYDMLG